MVHTQRVCCQGSFDGRFDLACQKRLQVRKQPSLVIAARKSDGTGPQPTSSVLSPAAGLFSKPEPDQRVMATQSDALAVSDDAWWEGRSAVEHGMVVSCRHSL